MNKRPQHAGRQRALRLREQEALTARTWNPDRIRERARREQAARDANRNAHLDRLVLAKARVEKRRRKARKATRLARRRNRP